MTVFRRIIKEIIAEYRDNFVNPPIVKGKQKIFCIGRNKTGTTSLREEFKRLGYITCNEKKGARLLDAYIKRDFKKIVEFCNTAQVFKDVPFSLPLTYKYMDKAFPNSKFILTVRDSPEQWYNSVINFHSKIFGHGGIPTIKDLKNARYIKKGWSWKLNREIFSTPKTDIYNKDILINHYNEYNRKVIKYFDKSDRLLVINVANRQDYFRFCKFLNVDPKGDSFPWVNKTEKIKTKN